MGSWTDGGERERDDLREVRCAERRRDAFCGSCGTCGAFLEFAADEAGAPDAAAVGSPTTKAAITEIRLYGILVTP